ncbi:MAG: YibE/F family protein, partial [Patescibacteria group bacterium]
VLGFYIVPKILAGQNPLVVTIIGSFFIATTALYLAHGFNKRTTVALGSTLITILIAIALSTSFVHLTNLTGIGSEEAFYLQTSPVQGINLKGLLLGGIIIGALGVLDDITTGQAAAVDEIFKANPMMTRRELISRSLSVGREHITSLVNTLALAYAGASFPTLLLFIIYQRPFWVVMNTESISEEVVRTLVGSIALMCAVPITTALAAYFLTGKGSSASNQEPIHSHHH